jgi:hypothetical protein
LTLSLHKFKSQQVPPCPNLASLKVLSQNAVLLFNAVSLLKTLHKDSNLIPEKLKFTEVLVEMVFVLIPVRVSQGRRSQ